MFRKISRLSFSIGVLAVTWLSLTPRDALPQINMWDKPQHLIAYAVLATCGAVGFLERRQRLMVGVGLMILGSGLELAQAAVPGRNASFGDVVANTAGIALGLAAVWIADRLVAASAGSNTKGP